MKSYSEMCRCGTFEERLKYLQLHGTVGKDTFGFDRYLNQDFYRSKEWRQFRDRIIVRDGGCDLGCKDHPIADITASGGKVSRAHITIHHINPLTTATRRKPTLTCTRSGRTSALRTETPHIDGGAAWTAS